MLVFQSEEETSCRAQDVKTATLKQEKREEKV